MRHDKMFPRARVAERRGPLCKQRSSVPCVRCGTDTQWFDLQTEDAVCGMTCWGELVLNLAYALKALRITLKDYQNLDYEWRIANPNADHPSPHAETILDLESQIASMVEVPVDGPALSYPGANRWQNP